MMNFDLAFDFNLHLYNASIPIPMTCTPKSDEERLLLASAKGDLATVKEMLDKGVDVEARDVNRTIGRLFPEGVYGYANNTSLHFACARDQVEVAKCLLEKAKKDKREIMYSQNGGGRIPFALALIKESTKCIELLLESGLDIRKFPPVDDENVEKYCDQPFSTDLPFSSIGINPFIFAISKRRDDVVKKMLDSLKKDSEKSAKEKFFPFLLPIFLPELANIVASYCSESEDFLNNPQNFNVSPLRFAKSILSEQNCILQFDELENPGLENPTRVKMRRNQQSAEHIVTLLKEAGAKDKNEEQNLQGVVRKALTILEGPPTKKHKKAK